MSKCEREIYRVGRLADLAERVYDFIPYPKEWEIVTDYDSILLKNEKRNIRIYVSCIHVAVVGKKTTKINFPLSNSQMDDSITMDKVILTMREALEYRRHK
jgi:hypothetical protein